MMFFPSAIFTWRSTAFSLEMPAEAVHSVQGICRGTQDSLSTFYWHISPPQAWLTQTQTIFCGSGQWVHTRPSSFLRHTHHPVPLTWHVLEFHLLEHQLMSACLAAWRRQNISVWMATWISPRIVLPAKPSHLERKPTDSHTKQNKMTDVCISSAAYSEFFMASFSCQGSTKFTL